MHMNVTKVSGLPYVPAQVFDTVSPEIKIIDTIKSNITMTAITDRISDLTFKSERS